MKSSPLLALLLLASASTGAEAGIFDVFRRKKDAKVPAVEEDAVESSEAEIVAESVSQSVEESMPQVEEVAAESSTVYVEEEPGPNVEEVSIDAATGDIIAEEDEPPQPVCKSDAAGVMRCTDPSEESNASDDPPTDQPKREPYRCQDIEETCAQFAQQNLGPDSACDLNSAYMAHHCPLTCNACDLHYLGYRLSEMLEGGLAIIPFCQDNNFGCRQFAESGECEKNPDYMNIFCEASCGICAEESNRFGVGQKLHKEAGPAKEKLVRERLKNSIDYMDTVRRDRKYKKVRDWCLNKVPDCTLWAATGECERNEGYMKVMCAPACFSCDYLRDTSETCVGLPESDGPLWKEPGDLNAFFEEIVDNLDGKGEYYQQYNPKALSRPTQRSDGTTAPGPSGPWVVRFENFLTDGEADRIVELGTKQEYDRSTIVSGKTHEAREGRTSGGTWCMEGCIDDPLVSRVLERIATTTKSSLKHSEHLQMLHYEPGQYYVAHHDFIPDQLDMPCGARIMTLYLYMNDVEEGGNTSFPDLGVSVKPKKGTALLWPNVLDSDPMARDPRMEHEAEVVVRGAKYGANAWIHSEDFQTPLALGCNA